MVKINSVMHGSPSDKCGVKKDDILVKINGHGIKDVLDYMYYAADTEVSLELLRGNETINLDISKDEYDDLGLEFETFLMDSKQSCSNKCVFCFIDQMPPGMRETLYFKDDDARLSFLQGNYVTLTNLHQEDIDRIIEMKLNINVSVHTTNPELRVKMMHNRFAGEKLKYIWQLAESGIKLNCQIVCCPGLNDGDELRRSLTDLGTLMPNITSMAVVPVGLTKFRKGLYPLVGFTKETAGETIDIIEEFQQVFLEKFGTRTVFPSDEFYLLSVSFLLWRLMRTSLSMKTASECSDRLSMNSIRLWIWPNGKAASAMFPLLPAILRFLPSAVWLKRLKSDFRS